jgi:hypothetical protein
MKRTTKAQRQAEWLAAFSQLVTTADPRHAGRIEWPDALHFYFTGLAPADAAGHYLETRPNGPGV